MNPSDREFELDHQLQGVPVPPDLMARLKSIPAGSEADAALDAKLNAVAVPEDLTEKLRQITTTASPVSLPELQPKEISPRHSNRWATALWSAAAAILVAVGIGWGILHQGPADIAQPSVKSTFPDPLLPTHPTNDDQPLVWLGPTSAELRTEQSFSDLTPLPGPDSLAHFGTEWTSPNLSADATKRPPRISSMDEQFPSDLLASTFLMRFQPLGANPLISTQPGRPQMIFPVTSPVSYFPTTKAYDRDFLLRESAQPFVSTQDAGLRTTSLPVSTAEQSYESVAFSEKPWSSELLADARMEQWLAATGRFYVPAQPGQLELRTAAGPAVFARDRVQLLQIGVVAGSADPANRPPAHITFAVTPPADSADILRTWMPVKIALREMIDHLQPHDTITLVVMSEFPYVLLEDVSVDDSEVWFAALDRIQPGEQSNLAEGIRLAAGTAIGKPGFGDIRRPLVVLSDRFPALDTETNRQLRPLVEDATKQHVDFTWVQLEDRHFASLLPAPSSIEGLGHWLVTNSLQDLSHLFDQQIHDAETLVGTNPTIEIKWNEKSVSQYRLIGYLPLGGDFIPASQTQELHAFDSGTVLFEVIMPEEGPNEVAQVNLQWQDPSGKLRKSTQKVSRLQFASSWHASPLSLQAAQLTAQSLSLQRNSYFSRRRGNTMDELESWAEGLNPALKQHASYPRLELLLPPTHL
ncbi:hypothetical protein DTL42_22810 [Bremerella cremea]|uniref:VWFA domain-containing protein n=1 Tax=Bremerella cremea TaxID=1031537 RepID=A0A368KNH4_9BACT|nr:hypothetical protein [Bremerella cremea]RCS41392.1 hypothetical protein DTL42_22810 [Bremerella cremea]